MMFEPERQDLSGLTPSRERIERMVAHVMMQSAGELRRRAAQVRVSSLQSFGLFDGLLAWSRPALATAAMLAALSLVALSQFERSTAGSEAPAFRSYFQTASLPAPVELWMQQGEAPSALDVMVVSDGEN